MEIYRKDSIVGYFGIGDLFSICKEISKIIGSEILPSHFVDSFQLFLEFDIIPWCSLWTQRYFDSKGLYVDIVQYAGDSNFYIIGGIDCSMFSDEQFEEWKKNQKLKNIKPSFSKPMQYLSMLNCFDDMMKKYAVSNGRNNLCFSYDVLSSKFHLKLVDPPEQVSSICPILN